MLEKDPKLAKIEFKQVVDQLRFKLSLSIQEFKIDHVFVRQFEDAYNQFSEINKYSNKRTELEVLKTLLTLLKVNSDFYNSGIANAQMLDYFNDSFISARDRAKLNLDVFILNFNL